VFINLKKRINLSIILILSFLFLFQINTMVKAVEIEGGTEENWKIESIDELIKIDKDGNADIRLVLSISFKEQMVGSTDYKLFLNLGNNVIDEIEVHPSNEDNINMTQYFNYSYQVSYGKTLFTINLSSDASNRYRFYSIGLHYQVDNWVKKKSECYESPIHWELQQYRVSR
jgi:hypothetical protein